MAVAEVREMAGRMMLWVKVYGAGIGLMKAMAALVAGALSLTAAQAASPRPRAPDFATRVLHDFATCVADRAPGEAAALLAMDYRQPVYQQRLRRLMQDRSRCLFAGRLKSNGVLFAGGMAERLLEKGREPAEVAGMLVYDPVRPPVQARDETEVMALCTVRTAPAEVAALLATKVASPEEEAAFRNVAPTAGKCLSSGQTLRVNRPGLRAFLALAAYRAARSNGRI